MFLPSPVSESKSCSILISDSAIMFSCMLALCDNDWSFSLNLKASLVLLLLRKTLECSLTAKWGTQTSAPRPCLLCFPFDCCKLKREDHPQRSLLLERVWQQRAVCVCVCVCVHQQKLKFNTYNDLGMLDGDIPFHPLSRILYSLHTNLYTCTGPMGGSLQTTCLSLYLCTP